MSGNILTDAEIVKLFFERDEAAIGMTDKKYRNYLLTVAYNILGDELDCEEVLNDTYLAAWHSIPPQKPDALSVYLSAIMRRIAIDRRRKKTSGKRIPSEFTESLEELDECLCISDDGGSGEISRILDEYLSGLGDTERDIFVCRYYFSDSIADIAKMNGMSRSSIFKKLSAMRAGLKEALEKENIL